MGWVNKNGALKWVQGNSNVVKDGINYKKNANSGNLTPQETFNKGLNSAFSGASFFSSPGMDGMPGMDVDNDMPGTDGMPGMEKGPGNYGKGTGIVTQNENSGNLSLLDTKDIDFTDATQVTNIQKALIDQGFLPETYVNSSGETVSSADGMWGNDTQTAYRAGINNRREGMGLMGYEYDDPNSITNTDIDSTYSPDQASANMYTSGGFGVKNMTGSSVDNNVNSNDLNERGFFGNLYDSIPTSEEIKSFWTLPGKK